MPKTASNLPHLFRSSGQDDPELRSTNSTAASDAEGRWPLLKAIPPKEPQPTPALTAQELQRWQPMESHEQARLTRPRSPPGLGNLMALSLKQMSKRANAEPRIQEDRSQSAVADTPTHPSHQAPLVPLTTGFQASPPEVMPKIVELAVTLEGIFSNKKPVVELTACDNTPADDSLKSVFSRLEDSKKQVKSSSNAEKRPSYLGRLGRK